jgi:hypothetical protein
MFIRVCSRAEPEWFDGNWMNGSGRGSRRYWRRNEVRAVLRRTTGSLSKRSCGVAEPACHGGISPMRLDRGKRSSIDSIGGPRRASRSDCSALFGQKWMTSGTALTARSIAPISMQRGETGGRAAGDRAVTRWLVDQGPPDRRRPWPCRLRLRSPKGSVTTINGLRR